jgi:hypothetical protein
MLTSSRNIDKKARRSYTTNRPFNVASSGIAALIEAAEESDTLSNQGNEAPGNTTPHGTSTADQVISRFIGDLSPEALLLAHVQSAAAKDNFDRDHLGIWMRDQRCRGFSDYSKAIAVSARNHAQQMRHLKLPSEAACDMLVHIYFSRINPLLGLVDERSFREARQRNRHSVVLLLAMVLVASRETSARPYLQLSDNDGQTSSPLPPRAFAQRIYSQLDWLLKAGLEKDKVTLIQAHGLMSLHWEGPCGNEDASLNLFTAVHHLQVLGIHLPRADETDRSGRARMLFWAIWVLDRLNAAFNGRPTLIHERDMADKPMFACRDKAERSTHGAFEIFVKITALLDKTIAMYRPNDSPPTGWEADFPGFEQLVEENAEMLSSSSAGMYDTRISNDVPLTSGSCARGLLSCHFDPQLPLSRDLAGSNLVTGSKSFFDIATAAPDARADVFRSPCVADRSMGRHSGHDGRVPTVSRIWTLLDEEPLQEGLGELLRHSRDDE